MAAIVGEEPEEKLAQTKQRQVADDIGAAVDPCGQLDSKLDEVLNHQRVLEEALLKIVLGCDAMTMRLDRLEAYRTSAEGAQAQDRLDFRQLEQRLSAQIANMNARVRGDSCGATTEAGNAGGVEQTQGEAEAAVATKRAAAKLEEAQPLEELRAKLDRESRAMWEAIAKNTRDIGLARQAMFGPAQPTPSPAGASPAARQGSVAAFATPPQWQVVAARQSPRGYPAQEAPSAIKPGKGRARPEPLASRMSSMTAPAQRTQTPMLGPPPPMTTSAIVPGLAGILAAQRGLDPPVGLHIDPNSLGHAILQRSHAMLLSNQAPLEAAARAPCPGSPLARAGSMTLRPSTAPMGYTPGNSMMAPTSRAAPNATPAEDPPRSPEAEQSPGAETGTSAEISSRDGLPSLPFSGRASSGHWSSATRSPATVTTRSPASVGPRVVEVTPQQTP